MIRRTLARQGETYPVFTGALKIRTMASSDVEEVDGEDEEELDEELEEEELDEEELDDEDDDGVARGTTLMGALAVAVGRL